MTPPCAIVAQDSFHLLCDDERVSELNDYVGVQAGNISRVIQFLLQGKNVAPSPIRRATVAATYHLKSFGSISDFYQISATQNKDQHD